MLVRRLPSGGPPAPASIQPKPGPPTLSPGPPRPNPSPGPGPYPGVIRPPMSRPPLRKVKRRSGSDRDSDSDSDSTSTYSSSLSSVRGHPGRHRSRMAKKGRRRCYHTDTESENEEDVIKVDVKLKRGDDLVSVLLALWTVAPVKGEQTNV